MTGASTLAPEDVAGSLSLRGAVSLGIVAPVEWLIDKSILNYASERG